MNIEFIDKSGSSLRRFKIQRIFARLLTIFSLMITGISVVSGSLTIITFLGILFFCLGAIWQISLYKKINQ